MSTMTIEYPDSLPTLSNQSVAEFEQESRLALAMKMYELGRWSSGQAARVAGIPRARFLLECPRFQVPTVSWDDDEIEAEFSGLAPQ
jgi:predicted HTH domain antitoxin